MYASVKTECPTVRHTPATQLTKISGFCTLSVHIPAAMSQPKRNPC